MLSRRLEDRIRELCAKTLRLSDVDLDSALDELREAVQMESERITQPLWEERRSA
jgi:septation ring formation regulator EzrA